jgi:hypothetical protein
MTDRRLRTVQNKEKSLRQGIDAVAIRKARIITPMKEDAR